MLLIYGFQKRLKNIKFPLIENNKTINLRFQHRWLQSYKWLAYSEIKQSGFCETCVGFSKIDGIGRQKLFVLVVKPMNNFKKALEVRIKLYFPHISKCKYYMILLPIYLYFIL